MAVQCYFYVKEVDFSVSEQSHGALKPDKDSRFWDFLKLTEKIEGILLLLLSWIYHE